MGGTWRGLGLPRQRKEERIKVMMTTIMEVRLRTDEGYYGHFHGNRLEEEEEIWAGLNHLGMDFSMPTAHLNKYGVIN